MTVQSENLIGYTLYSRTSPDSTCKILAVSPNESDVKSQRVYFCEITDWGQVDYQALSETEIQTYYSKVNDQALLEFYQQQLCEGAMSMAPARMSISEIRGADEVESFLKAIISDHPGVITSLHVPTPHRVITDHILKWLRGKPFDPSVKASITGTGKRTITRLPDPERFNERALFIEDVHEYSRRSQKGEQHVQQSRNHQGRYHKAAGRGNR